MIKCCDCNKLIKVKARWLRTCKTCGSAMCKLCNVEGYCRSCHPANTDTKVINDYYEDKYSEKVKKKLPGLMFLLTLMILLLPIANAFVFKNSIIEQDLTSFKWCIDNPFGQDTTSLKTDWLSYIDENSRCEITSKKVYAQVKTLTTKQECSRVYNCTQTPLGNSTVDICTNTIKCVDVPITITEQYDLEKNDLLLQKTDRVCLEVKRKAKIGFQSCDMNYLYKGEPVSKNAGFAWWNSTFNLKRQIFINATSNLNTTTQFAIKIVLNTTNFNYTQIKSDCGDIRFVNSAETETLDYFNEVCNTTGISIFYVNVTLTNSTNTTPYIYFNSTAVSRSSFNDTFGTELVLFMSGNNNISDISDNSLINNGSINGTINQVTDRNDIVERTFGHVDNPGTNDYFSYEDTPLTRLDGFASHSLVMWLNPDGMATPYVVSKGTNKVVYYLTAGGLWSSYAGAQPCTHSATTAVPVGGWTHLAGIWDGTDLKLYVNASKEKTGSCTWGGANGAELRFGLHGSSNDYDGKIDEIRLYKDRVLSDDFLELLFDQPTFSIGTLELLLLETSLDAGLFDINRNNISLLVDEKQEFFVWANYTFVSDGSVINDTSGFCNYSSDNIIDPSFNVGTGVNTTICASGCNFTNKTVTFTNLALDGFINDFYEISICHLSNPARSVTLATNCSNEVFVIPFSDIPLCAAGILNVSISSKNCSGVRDVNVSVWSAASALGHATRLLDDTITIHRRHNDSADLVFNVTEQLWVSTELHLFEEHGSESINVNCFENATGGVENRTVLLNITVVNIPPVVIIDEIWWWLLPLPVLFAPNIEGKYPLQNTLNITSQCVDDDSDTVIHMLNYSNNGSNIHTHNSGSQVGIQLNFTQSNFSTNLSFLDGTFGYTFITICNDTTGNTTTLERSFTAENSVPSVVWVNASPVRVSSNPVGLNWTCADDEGESMTSFLFVDGLLNVTTSSNGVVLNFSDGAHVLNVTCQDSFFNSSNATLNLIFSTACGINLFGVGDGLRFADNEINASLNCSNGVAVNNCGYSINNFAFVTVSNCSSFTVLAERGWNKLNFTVNKGLANQNSQLINFWAKDYDASIFQFPVLWAMLLVMVFALVMGTKYGIFYLVGGLAGVIVGFQLIAFSMMLGVIFSILSGLVGIGLFWKDI